MLFTIALVISTRGSITTVSILNCMSLSFSRTCIQCSVTIITPSKRYTFKFWIWIFFSLSSIEKPLSHTTLNHTAELQESVLPAWIGMCIGLNVQTAWFLQSSSKQRRCFSFPLKIQISNYRCFFFFSPSPWRIPVASMKTGAVPSVQCWIILRLARACSWSWRNAQRLAGCAQRNQNKPRKRHQRQRAEPLGVLIFLKTSPLRK